MGSRRGLRAAAPCATVAPMIEYAERTTTPARAFPLRLARAIWRQRAYTPRCPDTPRLDGKLAVVTGGNAGIGLHVSAGLARRGADVVIAARNRETSSQACARIGAETKAAMHDVPLDLSDLASVASALEELARIASGRRVDVLVANAGIWPQAYSTSAQGHEIAFATNTLGHHALVRGAMERALLSKHARVVVVTGDIYIRQRECTSDFRYEGRGGGALAYSRSKLGNLWFAAELQRRFPQLEVCSVHPGVIASNLGANGGELPAIAAYMRGMAMLDCDEGAETPLWCATQPIARGAYYHNTLGRISHPPDDPAADSAKAAALWERLEALRGDVVGAPEVRVLAV